MGKLGTGAKWLTLLEISLAEYLEHEALTFCSRSPASPHHLRNILYKIHLEKRKELKDIILPEWENPPEQAKV